MAVQEKARKFGNFLGEMGTETDRIDDEERWENREEEKRARDLRRINGRLNKEEADIGVHVVMTDAFTCFLVLFYLLCPTALTMYLSAFYNTLLTKEDKIISISKYLFIVRWLQYKPFK